MLEQCLHRYRLPNHQKGVWAMISEGGCAPVDVSDLEIGRWTGDNLFPVKLAQLWAKHVPRGKGWFPRVIGRLFADSIHCWIATKRGARLAVVPCSLDAFAAISNQGGTWNEHVFNTCARFLGKGRVFYDIGANVGYMAIEMAQLFGGDLSVVAV